MYNISEYVSDRTGIVLFIRKDGKYYCSDSFDEAQKEIFNTRSTVEYVDLDNKYKTVRVDANMDAENKVMTLSIPEAVGAGKNALHLIFSKENGIIAEEIKDCIADKCNRLFEEVSNKEDAVTIVDIADGAVITMKNNVVYRASGAIANMSFAFPEVIDAAFRCAIEFTCGDAATALVYPDTIIWTGDSLDVNSRFVPLHSHRYHIDIWFDGAFIRANASGVIA